jgi:hypothetical protein
MHNFFASRWRLSIAANLQNSSCHSVRIHAKSPARIELPLGRSRSIYGVVAPPRRLEFPIPLDESHAMLKLLQLHLERHSPGAAVVGFHLRVEPVDPRRVQGGLFLPPTPQPDQLQVTLARITALVGEENVGTPELVNSYRPDAFRFGVLDLRPFEPEPDDPRRRILRLSLRLFRPALTAQRTAFRSKSLRRV